MKQISDLTHISSEKSRTPAIAFFPEAEVALGLLGGGGGLPDFNVLNCFIPRRIIPINSAMALSRSSTRDLD